MSENEISYLIRGAVFEVYNTLGPGLLESSYQHPLVFELEAKGVRVEQQVALPLHYKGVRLDAGYRMDLFVESKVIVEIKSVEHLLDVHHKQLITI